MRLPRLSLSSVVDDILQIFGKRLLCDWQSEPTICDDVLVSSFSAIMLVSHWVYNLMQTHWSDLCMHFKYEFVHAFQDQANINIQITFFWVEKLIVHIHVLTKIFENLKVITLYSAVTKSELGNKMCMLTRSIQARKKNVHLSLPIVRPTSQRTPFSKFAICFMNSKLHHWSHKYNVITFFQKSIVLKSLSQWYMERYWSVYSLFNQLLFDANCSSE